MLDRWTTAWLAVCAALALHLADEVFFGSLGLYADFARVIGWIWPSIEMPPFHREVWLINLAGATLVLFALAWLVRQQRGVMVTASYLLAAFATANGVLHFLAAAALKSMIPGMWSAPLLIAAGLFLFLSIPHKRDDGGRVRATS
jgi:hypothetical protein